MRISKQEHQLIKKFWLKNDANCKVYLFGSRADDEKKGGDIDILILGEKKLSLSRKIQFKMLFDDTFGEQKIDILYYNEKDSSPFKGIALATAVRL